MRVFERMAMSCVLISVLCTQICVGTETFRKLHVFLCVLFNMELRCKGKNKKISRLCMVLLGGQGS